MDLLQAGVDITVIAVWGGRAGWKGFWGGANTSGNVSARLPFHQAHAEDPVLRDGRAARLGLPEHDFDRRFAHFILRNVHGSQGRVNNA